MDTIDGLFPAVIEVDGQLLEILAQIDVGDRQGGLAVSNGRRPFGWTGYRPRSELEQLLRGLLTQLGPEPPDIGHIPDTREEGYLSGIAAAAVRLLQHCRPDEAPNDAIDAALRLGLAERYGHRSLRERRDVRAELQCTPTRRRLAFWRAAEQRNEHRWLQGRPVEHIGQIALFGYAPGLGAEDLDWLLADAQARAVDHQRKLAITTALGVWRDARLPAESLARIEGAVAADPALVEIVQHWIRPPEPPPEQVERRAQI